MMLQVKDLNIAYGQQTVVQAVNFELTAGASLGVVGESGSGKSQTALAIMGLLTQASVQGQIQFNGQALHQLKPKQWRTLRGHQLAMIFQDPFASLNPYLSIGRQLTEVLQSHRGSSRKTATAESLRMLDAVGIDQAKTRFKQFPHQLSGGMQQRVMIAMALLCKPQLLIADEPTTALDVSVQAQILNLLQQLQADFGTALLFISHDLAVVNQLCDQVMVMKHGQCVEHGPIDQILQQPQASYTAQLLAAIPQLSTKP